MNSNKKSTASSFNGQPGSGQFKRVAVQLKTGISAQSVKRPVAPPVYRPTTTANAAQPKMANGVVNRKLPVAPPVYRPEAKKIVQPKIISRPPVYRPAKIANSIQPITAQRAAPLFRAVQLAKAVGAHECYARVVSNGGQKYSGEYNGIHAEINALESYLSSGGTLDNIASIELSSPPCKYCHIILSDLGIRHKVVCAKAGFGRCQGGSYGWWKPGGSVWAAIEDKTGNADPEDYAATVSARKEKLKAKK